MRGRGVQVRGCGVQVRGRGVHVIGCGVHVRERGVTGVHVMAWYTGERDNHIDVRVRQQGGTCTCRCKNEGVACGSTSNYILYTNLFCVDRRTFRASVILMPLFGLQLFVIIYRPPFGARGWREYEIIASSVRNSQVRASRPSQPETCNHV